MDHSGVPSSPSPARLGLLCSGDRFPWAAGLAWGGLAGEALALPGVCCRCSRAPPPFLLVTSAVASGPQTLFSPNCIAAEESHAKRAQESGLAELGLGRQLLHGAWIKREIKRFAWATDSPFPSEGDTLSFLYFVFFLEVRDG